MAKCKLCGKKGLFLRVSSDGFCSDCVARIQATKLAEEKRRAEEAERKRRAEEEYAARKKAADERLRQKMDEYNAMVQAIKENPVVISAKPAPQLPGSLVDEIVFSNITKKTPRGDLGNFVALDVETTGLYPSKSEVIDIAAIRFRDWRPVEKFTSLLSPKKGIPAEATKINGITEDMVAGKPTFQHIAESLKEFIGDDNLVGHNLEFDLGFVVKYGVDITEQERKYYDTLSIAQRTVKRVKSIEGNGVEDHKLKTLCVWYGIPNPKGHRAESDALAVGLLFKKLADDRQ